MKMKIGIIAVWGACAALTLFAPAAAQAQTERFYFKFDAGGALTMDTDLKEFLGPVAPGSKVKFNPGLRTGFGFGFQMTPWFAAEAETGFIGNGIDTVTGGTSVDASFSNVPFLINAKFQFPRFHNITPYFGGGGGGSISILDANELGVGGTYIYGTDSTVVFAYQAFGGIRFRLNQQMGLSLEYRYFATTEPSWQAEATFGTASDTIRFGPMATHALSLVFDWRF
jgi:opacity protein-like surface antigen